MANSIEFFRAGDPTVTGVYPLDVDTGLDARGICWGGHHDGGLLFWILLNLGSTGAAVLKLYRIDVAKKVAVQLGSFRVAAATDIFYGLTTDGTNLYILKTRLNGIQNDPYIDVHRCSNPIPSIVQVAAGPKEATPTDITFDGARLWWSYTLGGGGLEAPPILVCKLVARLSTGDETTITNDFPSVVGLEHTGDNTLRTNDGTDAANIGLFLKKDGQQINVRPLIGSALLAHYALCRFGRDDYAIVGA